jgi:hypothetical protein
MVARGQRQRDAVIRAVSSQDGRTYHTSIVWDRKAILVEEESPVEGQTEIVRHDIFAEAWLWRGGWFRLTFQPTLVMSWRPSEPKEPRPANFRELARQIIEECDLAELAAGDVEGHLRDLCAPHLVWPIFGYRYHSLTRRRVPHILLFGWPEGRPFPKTAPL